MKMKALRDYSPSMKKDQVMSIARIRYAANYGSGIAVQVVGAWKNPHWVDLAWFVEQDRYGTEVDTEENAAAPDMLEALKRAQRALNGNYIMEINKHNYGSARYREMLDSMFADSAEALKIVSAAIEQATND